MPAMLLARLDRKLIMGSQREILIPRRRRNVIEVGRGRLLVILVLFRALEHALERALDRRPELGGVIGNAGAADADPRLRLERHVRPVAGKAAEAVDDRLPLPRPEVPAVSPSESLVGTERAVLVGVAATLLAIAVGWRWVRELCAAETRTSASMSAW